METETYQLRVASPPPLTPPRPAASVATHAVLRRQPLSISGKGTERRGADRGGVETGLWTPLRSRLRLGALDRAVRSGRTAVDAEEELRHAGRARAISCPACPL